MREQIKIDRKKYYKEILDNLDEYAYRDKRYHINFSLAIGLSDETIDLSEFKNSKRKTDKFISLEKNLYCIVLDCTNDNSEIKATLNLQHEFQEKHFGKKLFIGVVCSKDYDNENNMINSLFDILEYSIDNNMNGIVVDKSQMLTQNH